MAIELLAKEAEGLTEEELQKVYEYIQFLKNSMGVASTTDNDKKTIKRTPEGLIGPLVMTEDFDETPDCFKEYM